MKTSKLPAAAFQTAMESAAASVNEKPALKSVSEDMKKTTPLPPAPQPAVAPAPAPVVGRVMENIEGAIVLTEDPRPKQIHDFAEKYNLVVHDKRTGKKAVRCEVWQFILENEQVTPSLESEYSEAGIITTCRLFDKGGKEISHSSTIASNTEPFLKDKPAYAVWGMSQTRALSRAAKNVYGHLVVMAGYSATPSDEMDYDDAPATSEGAAKVSNEDEIARLAGRKK